MNPLLHTIDPADDEQASLWAARLDDGELSTADQRELDAWLAANPPRRALVGQYCRLSAELERKLPALVEAGVIEPPRPPASPLRRWWPAFAGAGLVAAAGVAFLLWPTRAMPTQTAQLATPAAHRQTLTLADGTRVELFARTRLSAEIGQHRRHVQLHAGEAFFSVTKDATRPFVVETAAGTVQVTGTQFDVRTIDRGGLEVIVAEGSVLVSPAEVAGQNMAPVVLVAGSRLSTASGRVAVDTLGRGDLGDALAWRQGKIVFAGTPLREALAGFARYHDRAVTASPEVADLHVGGLYSLDDLDGFLASIAEVWPLQITHNPDNTVQVSRRSEN